jgi:hypothetical protein
MAGKHIIREVDFAAFIACPASMARGFHREHCDLEAATGALRWLLQCCFDDRLPDLADVRAALETEWKHLVRTGAAAKPEYTKALRGIPRVARRLHGLAVDHIVMHPVTSYTLPFGRNQVRGEYAALTKPMRPDEPLILRLRSGVQAKTEQRKGPSPVSLLRWLHFRTWEATLPMARVLNYALDAEESWMEFFDERGVRTYLSNAAANLADRKIYAAPGEHCLACPTQGCAEVSEVFKSWTR